MFRPRRLLQDGEQQEGNDGLSPHQPLHPAPPWNEGNYINIPVAQPTTVVPPPPEAIILPGIPIARHHEMTTAAQLQQEEPPRSEIPNNPLEQATSHADVVYGHSAYIPRTTGVSLAASENKGGEVEKTL